MSFSARENAGGTVIECYRFTQGISTLAEYTSADTPRTIDLALGDPRQFFPLAIKRDAVQSDTERDATAIRITLPIDSVIGALFKNGRPLVVVEVSIYRALMGVGDAGRVFYGEVVGASISDLSVVLKCEPKSHAITRPILRVLYQAPCNNNLYDEFCAVNRDNFDTLGTVSAIAADRVSLTIVEADALVDGWFTAGMLKFGNEYGFIRSHLGSIITLIRPVPGLAVSSAVTLYAGCDRSLATCRDKFNNVPNHLGFPFMPAVDAFKSGIAD